MKSVTLKLISMTVLLVATTLSHGVPAIASTTWYVNGVTGSNNNDCRSTSTACATIGHAISLAGSGDSVMVAPATYREHPTIDVNLSLLGAGAPTTIIDGGGSGSTVVISAGINVTIANVTIRGGRGEFFGGGIYNHGNLTIIASAITNNVVGSYCQRYCAWRGGGIDSEGAATLTVIGSTISGNRVQPECFPTPCHFGGGGIDAGTLVLSNSTVSGNAPWGINGGPAEIRSSTIASNGGGIYVSSATLQNSILAGNKGTNCVGGTIISIGYNLSSDGTCPFTGPGDKNITDPKLGALGNYGGPTQTIPLLSSSPAIDAGDPGGCTDAQGRLLTTDQRGYPRPDKEDKDGCDMGAYESQSDYLTAIPAHSTSHNADAIMSALAGVKPSTSNAALQSCRSLGSSCTGPVWKHSNCCVGLCGPRLNCCILPEPGRYCTASVQCCIGACINHRCE